MKKTILLLSTLLVLPLLAVPTHFTGNPIPIKEYYFLGAYKTLTVTNTRSFFKPETFDGRMALLNTETNSFAKKSSADLLSIYNTGFSETSIINQTELSANFPAFLSENGMINVKYLNSTTSKSNLFKTAYLAAAVVCEKETTAMLSGGSANGITIRLNGKEIYNAKPGQWREMYWYDNVPLTLQKGTNMFLFKINHLYGNWALSYWLGPTGNVENISMPEKFYIPFAQNSLLYLKNFERKNREKSFKVPGYYIGFNHFSWATENANCYDASIKMMKNSCLLFTNKPNLHAATAYALRTLLVKKAMHEKAKPLCGLNALETAAESVREYSDKIQLAENKLPINYQAPVIISNSPYFANANYEKNKKNLKSQNLLLPGFSYLPNVVQAEAAYPGLGISQSKLFELLPPINSNGYSLAALAIIAKNAGYKVLPVNIDYETLCASVTSAMPAICFMERPGTAPDHFITIKSADDKFLNPDINIDDWHFYKQPFYFNKYWKGIALFICSENILDTSPKLSKSWKSLSHFALSLNEAKQFIGSTPLEDECDSTEGTSEKTGKQVSTSPGENGGCSSCAGASGMSIFPTYTIRRHGMVVELKVTPLAYNADNNTSVKFTLSRSDDGLMPDRLLGHRWQLNFDAWNTKKHEHGKITYVTNKFPLVKSFEFKENCKLTVVRDDSLKFLPILKVRDSKGRESVFEYSANKRNIISITDPFGRKVNFSYYDNKNLKSITDPIGRTTSFIYDRMARVTEIITPVATNKFEYTDDILGMTTGIKTFDAAGRCDTYTWTPDATLLTDKRVSYKKTRFSR